MSQPISLPYGLRDLKITKYTDALGTTLAGTSIDLSYMQTLSFKETEDFEELRGDDSLISTRGKGAQVEWDLEAAGISFYAWQVMNGAEIIETGTTPNRKTQFRKQATQARPYFRIEGQVISDSGGDLHCFIYRARLSGDLEGQFGDGAFFISKAAGTGLPLVNSSTFPMVYEFVQNETAVAITTTPTANPTS